MENLGDVHPGDWRLYRIYREGRPGLEDDLAGLGPSYRAATVRASPGHRPAA